MRKLLWITSVLTLLAFPAYAATLLNGMAVHQELGRDQFIGALYTDTLTDSASVVLAANMPIRMELKITSDTGLTARRFSRLWVEGMAINVRSDTLTAQADNMVAFTRLFKGRLNQDDHVVFELTPGDGVDVSVNGILLGNIADDEFFSLLASAWVGNVPLSSTFRESLLATGEVDSGLVGRYEAISPSQGRVGRVAAWVAPPEPEPRPEPEPEPEPTVAAAPEPEPEPESDSQRPAIDIQVPPINAQLDLGQDQDQERAPESPADPAAEPEPAAPEPTAPAEQDVASSPAEDEEEDEEALPIFTAESLLANQRYFSNLNLTIRRNLTYPRRATQRGYEGSMRIAIVLDRNGNLLSADFLEESNHSILNRTAMDTIEDLAPFPPIPAAIPGNRHDFTIPITFELAEQ